MRWCAGPWRPALPSPPEAVAARGEGGYFYSPRCFAGCRQEMEIIRREIFGPVIPIVTFNDLDEAIACAKRFPTSG